MNFIEEWRNVRGYEGIYQVSNLGNIKSLNRVACDGRNLKGKIKSISTCSKYKSVRLYKNSKGKTFTIHQLVAVAFLGHIPNKHTLQVDHIDNNPLNNRVDNLQIITSRLNSSKDRVGTSKYTGVSWYKPNSKWVAHIRINGVLISLGYFNVEEEAAMYYDNALQAHLNGNKIVKKLVKTSSVYKGVCWDKRCGKWMARTKGKFLGYFLTEDEAKNKITHYNKNI